MPVETVSVYRNESGNSELVLMFGPDGALRKVLHCPVVRAADDPTQSRYRDLSLGSDRPQWNDMRYVIDLYWRGGAVELVRNHSRLRLDGEAFFFHGDRFEQSQIRTDS